MHGITTVHLAGHSTPDDDPENEVQPSSTCSSMAELVRRAIDRTYLSDTEVERRLAGLRASAGVWADRDDIGDTVDWLRAMRGDPEERFRKLWGDR